MPCFMRSALLSVALAPFVLGAAHSKPRNACKTFDDNYDQLAAIPDVSEVGTYNGLTYQAWDVVGENNLTSATLPHTSPNVAVADLRIDVVQLGSTSLHPFGNIIAGPGTKYFDASSFYFGCGENTEEAIASISVGCVISVTGFYITGQQIPSTTFSFAPTKAEGAPLVLGVFPSTYVALKNLTLALAAGGAVGDFTNTVLTIDDFVHCNYS